MQLQGQRNRSPADQFLFSMVRDGPRGLDAIEPIDDRVEDIEGYGIDWEVADEPQYMNHLLDNNPHALDDENPFRDTPFHLHEVPCDPPDCPFSADVLQLLDQTLAAQVSLESNSMLQRRLVWQAALQLCIDLYQLPA